MVLKRIGDRSSRYWLGFPGHRLWQLGVLPGGGLLGILREETTAVKREETGTGPREKPSCDAVAAGDSRRDVWAWDGRVELSQVRQGLSDAGWAVPWEGEHPEWGSFVSGEESCELSAEPARPEAEGTVSRCHHAPG